MPAADPIPTAAPGHGPDAGLDEELDELIDAADDAGRQADDVLATADEALRGELDELFDEAAYPTDDPPPEPAVADAGLDDKLDTLFNDLAAGDPRHAPDEADEVAPAPAPPTHAAVPSDVQALRDELAADRPKTAEPDADAREDADGRTPERTPLWLRVLMLLNAPFAALPPRVRDAAGKVALVTLANALALLAYRLLM